MDNLEQERSIARTSPSGKRMAGEKRKRVNPIRVKGYLRSDGCILPGKPPKVLPDGRFKRPVGRQPVGMLWDGLQGIWRPSASENSSATVAISGDGQQTNHEGQSIFPRRVIESYMRPSQKTHVRIERRRPEDAMYDSPRRRSGEPQSEEANDDSSQSSASPSEDDSLGEHLHPTSRWREPFREDGLTLYELHRKPRPVPRGVVSCPVGKAILKRHAFLCAICLGPLRNTRVVRECLHRFCEDCIDRCFRVKVQRSYVCPICRIVIPSKRSLIPDPVFDALVETVLSSDDDGDDDAKTESATTSGNTVSHSAASHARDGPHFPPNSLQHAIHRKQQHQGDSRPIPEQETTPTVTANAMEHHTSSLQDNIDDSIPWMDVCLLKDRDEAVLDSLERPYLRLKATATVGVLKQFLCQKLWTPSTTSSGDIKEQSTDTESFQLAHWIRLRDRPIILTDWMTLATVAKAFGGVKERVSRYETAIVDEDDTVLYLYYRRVLS